MYSLHLRTSFLFFFFNNSATTEIYTLSLHDALPIAERGGDRADADLERVAVAHQLVRDQRADHLGGGGLLLGPRRRRRHPGRLVGRDEMAEALDRRPAVAAGADEVLVHLADHRARGPAVDG